MVEINNQRAVLDMLAWLRNWITDVRKPGKSWLWRHCRRRAIYWLLRSPRKLVTLNPKLKSTGAGRYQLLSRWQGCLPQAAWPERLSGKVRMLWHCSRLRSVALTYDWSWWYPSGNRPLQQYLGFTAGRWLWLGVWIRLTAWLQNSKKRAERSEIDVWAESPRLSPPWLSASSSGLSWATIITVITPLPTKPSARQKCQRTEAGEIAAITDMQMRHAMLLRSRCKIHEGVSWC